MPDKSARKSTRETRPAEALQQSEQLLRSILETAVDAIITINDRGIIQSANPATERLFGYSQMELLGQNVNLLMPEPFHREHDGYLRHYLRTGDAKIIGIGRDVTGLCKDGTTFPVHLSVSEVRLGTQRLFTGILHDLSERRRLENQIIQAAANEQRRIGQDLHDGLCQDLVGIAFAISNVARSLPPDASDTAQSLADLAAAVRASATQARDLSHGLNPVDLKAGGLPVALENFANKVSDSFSVKCVFNWDRRAQVGEDSTASHLYRIAQESVGNAIRHGKAGQIEIGLGAQDGSVTLSISDNGTGIPPEVIRLVQQGLPLTGLKQPRAAGSGIGFLTMTYRAKVIGASLSVERRKGGGSIVVCTIGRGVSSEASGKTSGKSRSPKQVRPR